MQILRIFITILALCTFAFAEKQILILNSYHKGFEWSDKVIGGIETIFHDKAAITTNILYMDSKRINSEDYFAKIGELYKIQLNNQHYDLIIAIDTFAYDFVLKYYDLLFEDEPILFTGPEHFDIDSVKKRGLEDKTFGILEHRAINDNISIILKTIPNLKKLTIINDSSDNGDDTNPFIQKVIDKYKDKIKLSYIRNSTLKKLEKLFSTPKKNEAILFVRFYNDENGNLYKNSQIASMIDKSKLPVFVTDTLFIKRGALGGKLVDIEGLGKQTGKMALSIFENRLKPLHVKTFGGYKTLFDLKKIEEFGINLNNLKSATLINTPPSFFDRYRTLVNDIFVLSPFLVFLIIGLIYNMYKRVKSEKELKKVQEQKNKHQQFVIQQSKLAEIGEIFSSIAHQWKNPLVEISAIAQEHFYKNHNDKIQNNTYVDDIMVQVGYMSDTINDFQTFIMPSSKKIVFDIEKSIQTTTKIMSHTIKYNYINVHVNKKGVTNFKVLGYKNEFMQTLLNIFNNAKDAIIQAREDKLIQKGEINIDIFNEENQIILHIKDNGGGIKAKSVKRVFEPYFTTKKQGHGIGLYMSKLIIEDKMNGSINVSNCQNGACFTIKLENI